MGLTGRVHGYLAMSSQLEPQLKYRYQFKLEAKRPGVFEDNESKAMVQSYINELLGVKEKPRENEKRSQL